MSSEVREPGGISSSRTFVCPHCGVHSLHFAFMSGPGHITEVTLRGIGGTTQKWGARLAHFVYRCVGCEKDTYFLTRPPDKAIAGEQVLHQYPVVMPVIHESIPVEVKKAAIEAEKCLSVRAYNACGVMARRSIHALCQDKDAKGRDLYEQLEFLRDRHQITPDLWQWAEELRIIGRSGAHPEWEEVSADDADYAVRFLREIIRYVYINPFEREQRRLKETKKKKDPPQGGR